MSIPQQKISELVIKYKLEPSLVDIYVEGEFDKKLLTWFIKESGVKQDIRIITPDAIDVPDSLLRTHSLNLNSNRSKVIAIAKELYIKVPEAKILCIADKDYDEYLPHPNYSEGNLIFTDYNSMDLYWLNDKVWNKIMILSFGYSSEKSSLIFNSLLEISTNIFLMRLVNESLKLGLTLKEFCKSKYINIDNLEFDIEKYLRARLTSAGKISQYTAFRSEMGYLRSKLKTTPQSIVRGHDFFEILHYYLQKTKNHIKIVDHNSFQVAFMGCIELQDLKNNNLFDRILNFANQS